MLGHEFIPTEAVDARIPEQMAAAREKHRVAIHTDLWTPKAGHIGVWYSMLNAWDHGGPLLHFEDDAILHPRFHEVLEERMSQLPSNTDFYSLFIPRDSDHLYLESMSRSEDLTRPYASYGGVSMYFTERGIDKIHKLLKEQGIWCQWDDWLYRLASNYRLNGFVSKPSKEDLVTITGLVPSIAQDGAQYVG